MRQMRSSIRMTCMAALLCALAAATMYAQGQSVFAGDSVRVQQNVMDDSTGEMRNLVTMGRVVSLHDAQLRVTTDTGTAIYDVANIARLDRYEKTNKWKTFGIAMALGVASGTVAYLVQPVDKEQQVHGDGCVITLHSGGRQSSVCRSHVTETESRKIDLTTYQLIGAGVALAGWGISVGVSKGHWSMVIHR